MLLTSSTDKTQAFARFLRGAVLALALVVPVVVTKISPAGFTAQDVRAHVEIDGVDYGAFDVIDGLEESVRADDGGDEPYRRITLRRDFVTDPSLYLWAKNIMHGRSDLKDVHVVMESRDGEEVARYVLKFCQPLAWTVEAANPASGGFHEKIDLAVQEVQEIVGY